GVIPAALPVLTATHDTGLRLQAIRLIMLALGDYHLHNPALELNTGYSLQGSLAGREAIVRQILQTVRPIFPSGDARLDQEAARLLAMLEDDSPDVPRKVAGFWTPASSPTWDLHYLIVFSRLRAP